MADLAISGLPIASALTGVELLPIVQGGVTSQTTASAMLTYVGAGLTVSNGLTNVAGNIKLGGALTANTTISGSYYLNITANNLNVGTTSVGARVNFKGTTSDNTTSILRLLDSTDAHKFNVRSDGRIIAGYDDSLLANTIGHVLVSPTANPTDSALVVASSGFSTSLLQIFNSSAFEFGNISSGFRLSFDGTATYMFNGGTVNVGIASMTASRVAVTSAGNYLASSSVTSTELGLLSGLTGFTGTGTLLAKGTSPVFTTDITTPLIYGGSAVGSQLNLQGTSGNGTSTVAAINFLVGNNGATTAGKIYNDGTINLGNAVNTSQRLVRIGQDTSYIDIGSWIGNTTYAALHMNAATPSTSNYVLLSNGSVSQFNGVSSFSLRVSNTEVLGTTGNRRLNFSPQADNGGSTLGFNFVTAANTNQTLSTASPDFLVTLANKQWATGALAATQKFFSITQPTISFVGASTATLVSTFAIAGAPIQGTNATNTTSVGLLVEAGAITGATTSYGAYINAQTGGSTNYALGVNGVSNFEGNIRLTQTVTTEALVSDTSVTIVINGTTYKLLARA